MSRVSNPLARSSKQARDEQAHLITISRHQCSISFPHLLSPQLRGHVKSFQVACPYASRAISNMLLLFHTFSVLCPRKDLRDLYGSRTKFSQANQKNHQLRTRSACGHKEAQRSTGHIMVTSCCVHHHHGSKSRQTISSSVVLTNLEVDRYASEKSHKDETQDN